MQVKLSSAKKLLTKWQPALRLGDWDIRIGIVRRRWRKSGDIKIDDTDKKAILLLNAKPLSENLEETIVHELLHLKLWGLDQMLEDLLNTAFGKDMSDPKREFAYNQFMTLLEVTVEDLTKGYLAAAGRKNPLSFGRIRSKTIRC